MLPHINELVKKQKSFYLQGHTRDIDFRINALRKIKESIVRHETEILAACKEDLSKSSFEAYAGEIMSFLDDVKLCMKQLRSWAKPVKLPTPLSLFQASSRVYYEPYGTTLIIGTWNYPFLTTLVPLIGAISAGNCAVIKTSEIAPAASKVIAKIIRSALDEKYCAVVEGAAEETTALLNEKFDLIFFTGSPHIGRIIAQAAAKSLTPTVLELGGKSPCIVDETANIEFTAKRIAWGKYMNAGQICTSPDYLVVHKAVKDKLLQAIIQCAKDFYGENAQTSPDYCRIANEKHFDRLISLMKSGKILFGGKTDKTDLFISPTVIDQVTWDDLIMKEEIFGPILPVMEYEDIDKVISMLHEQEKPLALYVFSTNQDRIRKVISQTSSGGVCINATIMHVMNPHMPFGGVGNSGIGKYHGKSSFETFSHRKSVLDKSLRFDPSLLYPPYKDKIKILRLFTRFTHNLKK